jgi:type VI secretion system protein ImpL
MTQLQMVVPVYVLFTKCDLIAGFNEFFGDMRKSDRAQAWGATLKLDMDKSNPGKIFDEEFEVLRKQIHARSLKRLATERNRDAREKIYQFPLEFAGVKRNLSEMIATAFAVNAFQGTPILRGFYFTSGTQEGRPLDRVLGRMGQAMGIRPPETAVQQVVESKSYFLHDVFMNVVFPDGSIAARSASEIRRQRLMRVAIASAAAALAVIVAAPGVNSFLNNRAFLKDTLDRVKQADAIDWNGHDPAAPKLDQLAKLLDRLKEIDEYKATGLPVSMKWGMYQGDIVSGQATAEYVKIVQTAMVSPVRARLEAKLKLVKGDHYVQERTLLKQYLMLSDIKHLDVLYDPEHPSEHDNEKDDGTEVGAVTWAWAEILKPFSNVSDLDLRAKIRPHVRYYLKLLKAGRVAPLPANEKLVAEAQKTLMSVPVAKRYYDLFVNSLIDEKYNEAGEDVLSNRRYPPITLGDLFADRADVLKVLTSAKFVKEKRFKEVEGPYTEKGHYRVLRNVKQGAGLLEDEQWVVPLGPEEKGDRVPVNLKHLAEEYDQRYGDEWSDWLLDMQVTSPATVKQAIELYSTLSNPERPYMRILRMLEDNTQWKDSKKEAFENEEVNREAKRRLQEKLSGMTRGLRIDVGDLRKIGDKTSTVPGIFKKTIEFAIPGTNTGGDTPLNKYMTKLDALRGQLAKEEDTRGPNLDPRLVQDRLDDALKDEQELLQGLDDKAKTILTPWLTNPLRIVTTRLPPAGTQQVAVPPTGRKWRRP